MSRETITPTSEADWHRLRALDLTSTDCAALFGLSPYCTLFELWHRKKGALSVDIPENDRMKWGGRLESAIAAGIAEDQGWTVAPMKDYKRMPEHRLGSSFDYRIITGNSENDGILEIKNVDWLAFKNGWTMEGDELVAPAHIELQVQHQMLVSGLKWARIAAFIGGNDTRLLARSADEQVHLAILNKARAFWRSIETNTPPPATYPGDASAIIALHQHAEPGKVIDAPEAAELIEAYKAAAEQEKQANEAKETAKARLLTLIGDAEKATCGPHTISAAYQGEVEIPAYTRAGFRAFRVTTKKGK